MYISSYANFFIIHNILKKYKVLNGEIQKIKKLNIFNKFKRTNRIINL